MGKGNKILGKMREGRYSLKGEGNQIDMGKYNWSRGNGYQSLSVKWKEE